MYLIAFNEISCLTMLHECIQYAHCTVLIQWVLCVCALFLHITIIFITSNKFPYSLDLNNMCIMYSVFSMLWINYIWLWGFAFFRCSFFFFCSFILACYLFCFVSFSVFCSCLLFFEIWIQILLIKNFPFAKKLWFEMFELFREKKIGYTCLKFILLMLCKWNRFFCFIVFFFHRFFYASNIKFNMRQCFIVHLTHLIRTFHIKGKNKIKFSFTEYEIVWENSYDRINGNESKIWIDCNKNTKIRNSSNREK